MATFETILSDAQRGREEAQELAHDITAGIARLSSDMSRERALEVVNGCIGDYNSIIKRLRGRHRG